MTRDIFHAQIRAIERTHNAGCTTRYDARTDTTEWVVAGRVVGTSSGRVGACSNYRLSGEAA